MATFRSIPVSRLRNLQEIVEYLFDELEQVQMPIDGKITDPDSSDFDQRLIDANVLDYASFLGHALESALSDDQVDIAALSALTVSVA